MTVHDNDDVAAVTSSSSSSTSAPSTSAPSNLNALGVMVGLEIHQQLATGKKLFCGCSHAEPDSYPIKFSRRLRSASGELGIHDPAALFESTKEKIVRYYADYGSSCLVEQDEEPPHGLDADAKKTAMIIASALKSRIYTEMHTMRKTVVDGSNTTGFQRTILVAEGGSFEVFLQDGGKSANGTSSSSSLSSSSSAAATNTDTMAVGIQSVCLEEDAAKILDAGSHPDIDAKGYGLERLGIPLVEIATGPFVVSDPDVVRTVAHSLGRILRSTRMVTRGLGSIRQDVNVSIADGGGTVVEVKGVQQLEQLADVVSYEAYRQHGLLRISEMLQKSKWSHDATKDRTDATDVLKTCKSKIIQKAIKQDHTIMAVAFRGAHGIFGYSPYTDVRLGREIADLVRLFGVGGVFHSDELPAYGITKEDIDALSKILDIDVSNDNKDSDKKDAFLMFAAPKSRVHTITDQIISRVQDISANGIPADTRLATQDGKTAFLRPRPGAARMYPETDVPTITVTKDDLDVAAASVPKPWREAVSELESAYGINTQLAEQLWDSTYLETFKTIASMYDEYKGNRNKERDDAKTATSATTYSSSSLSSFSPPSPAFVASTLCSTITSLERQPGCNPKRLDDAMILETFDLLGRGKIAKESVEIIFQKIMSGEAETTTDAIKSASIGSMNEDEIASIVNKIILDNAEMIKNQKERAIGPLMGIAMKQLRGKAPGSTVNELLAKGIKDKIEGQK